MRNVWRAPGCAAALLGAALLSWAQPPAPGAVNFVEGSVSLAGKPLGTAISDTTRVAPGNVLETAQGRAEVLLTPGVFVRLGENSALKLVAASAAATRIELLRGQALVEVIRLDRQNRLEVVDKQAYARPLREGLYLFNAEQPAIAVYQGKVRVDDDQRHASLGSGQELLVNGSSGLKAQKFDVSRKDALYEWSGQRAAYVAGASESTVYGLLAFELGASHNDGWYWNPWFHSWAFIPQQHYRASPFGYGYYPPDMQHNYQPLFSAFRR